MLVHERLFMIMQNLPIISTIILIPVVTSIYLMLFTSSVGKSYVKALSLLSSLIVLFTVLYLYKNFDHLDHQMQFTEQYLLVKQMQIYYHVGIDGMSLLFVMLTALLTVLAILFANNNDKEFFISFLFLEALVIGAFTALDLLLFYFFFEATLIPMFLIIGIWGGENRIYATLKFFIYTLFCPVFFLLAILYIYTSIESFDIVEIAKISNGYTLIEQKYLWLAFFIAFAVKVPMWPFHTWLPDAHVQAPTAGSLMLAGVLIKLGAYGMIRFLLPMFPDATVYFADYVIYLSIIAIIYTSLVAFAQEDMKKMIAYSSVAHMGYVTAGIFTLTKNGIDGAIFQMLSHGLISAGLFLVVGVLYERMHTKEIIKYGGTAAQMPIFAVFFMILTMGSVGLPGTSGFVGEFLGLNALAQVNFVYSALASTGIIFGAVYMLSLYKRVMFGKAINELQDINLREILSLAPLILLVIYLGICSVQITNLYSHLSDNLMILFQK